MGGDGGMVGGGMVRGDSGGGDGEGGQWGGMVRGMVGGGHSYSRRIWVESPYLYYTVLIETGFVHKFIQVCNNSRPKDGPGIGSAVVQTELACLLTKVNSQRTFVVYSRWYLGFAPLAGLLCRGCPPLPNHKFHCQYTFTY